MQVGGNKEAGGERAVLPMSLSRRGWAPRTGLWWCGWKSFILGHFESDPPATNAHFLVLERHLLFHCFTLINTYGTVFPSKKKKESRRFVLWCDSFLPHVEDDLFSIPIPELKFRLIDKLEFQI